MPPMPMKGEPAWKGGEPKGAWMKGEPMRGEPEGSGA